MYGMDAGMGGMMKKIAAKKAKKKDESGTSKIGKMLDKKEMSNAPRRPSVTKAKPTTLELKPGLRKNLPARLRKMKDK